MLLLAILLFKHPRFCWRPYCVGRPLVAFIPAVAFFSTVVGSQAIAVILAVACCWRSCCCSRSCLLLMAFLLLLASLLLPAFLLILASPPHFSCCFYILYCTMVELHIRLPDYRIWLSNYRTIEYPIGKFDILFDIGLGKNNRLPSSAFCTILRMKGF